MAVSLSGGIPSERARRQALELLGDSFRFDLGQAETDLSVAKSIVDMLKTKCVRISNLEESALAALALDSDTLYVRAIPANGTVEYARVVALLGNADSWRPEQLKVCDVAPLLSLTRPVIWHRHGWLEFAVGAPGGKVAAVQVDCRQIRPSHVAALRLDP